MKTVDGQLRHVFDIFAHSEMAGWCEMSKVLPKNRARSATVLCFDDIRLLGWKVEMKGKFQAMDDNPAKFNNDFMRRFYGVDCHLQASHIMAIRNIRLDLDGIFRRIGKIVLNYWFALAMCNLEPKG